MTISKSKRTNTKLNVENSGTVHFPLSCILFAFSFSVLILFVWVFGILLFGLKATRVECSFVSGPSVNHRDFVVCLRVCVCERFCVFHFLQTNSFVTLCECLVFICGLNRTETFEKKSNGRKRNNQIYLVERSILFFFCCCLIYKHILDPLIRCNKYIIYLGRFELHVLVEVMRIKGGREAKIEKRK